MNSIGRIDTSCFDCEFLSSTIARSSLGDMKAMIGQGQIDQELKRMQKEMSSLQEKMRQRHAEEAGVLKAKGWVSQARFHQAFPTEKEDNVGDEEDSEEKGEPQVVMEREESPLTQLYQSRLEAKFMEGINSDFHQALAKQGFDQACFQRMLSLLDGGKSPCPFSPHKPNIFSPEEANLLSRLVKKERRLLGGSLLHHNDVLLPEHEREKEQEEQQEDSTVKASTNIDGSASTGPSISIKRERTDVDPLACISSDEEESSSSPPQAAAAAAIPASGSQVFIELAIDSIEASTKAPSTAPTLIGRSEYKDLLPQEEVRPASALPPPSAASPSFSSSSSSRRKPEQRRHNNNRHPHLPTPCSPSSPPLHQTDTALSYHVFLDRLCRPESSDILSQIRRFIHSVLGPNGQGPLPRPRDHLPQHLRAPRHHHPSSSSSTSSIKTTTGNHKREDERKKLVDQYQEFMGIVENSMRVHPAWSRDLRDGKSHIRLLSIRNALEKYVLDRIGHVAFQEMVDEDGDRELGRRLRVLCSFVTPDSLDIPPTQQNPLTIALAQAELRRMHYYPSPVDKLQCLMRTASIIFSALEYSNALNIDGEDCFDTEREVVTIDDFLATLIYVVLGASVPQLKSTCEYINAYHHPDGLMGREGCFLSHLMSAVAFLTCLNDEVVNIPDFDEKLRHAEATIL